MIASLRVLQSKSSDYKYHRMDELVNGVLAFATARLRSNKGPAPAISPVCDPLNGRIVGSTVAWQNTLPDWTHRGKTPSANLTDGGSKHGRTTEERILYRRGARRPRADWVCGLSQRRDRSQAGRRREAKAAGRKSTRRKSRNRPSRARIRRVRRPSRNTISSRRRSCRRSRAPPPTSLSRTTRSDLL